MAWFNNKIERKAGKAIIADTKARLDSGRQGGILARGFAAHNKQYNSTFFIGPTLVFICNERHCIAWYSIV